MTNLVTTNPLVTLTESGPTTTNTKDDQLADEFAAMFASFCVLQPTEPVATPEEPVTEGLTISEVPVEITDSVEPKITLLPIPNTEAEEFDIPLPPAPPPTHDQIEVIEQNIEPKIPRLEATPNASHLAVAIESTFDRNLPNTVRGYLFNLEHQSPNEKREPLLHNEAFTIRELTTATASTNTTAVDSPDQAASVRSQTIDQLIALAETTHTAQTKSLRFRLRPRELGQIEIQLHRDAEGRISAELNVERESARQVLSQTIGELRDALARAGFTVDKVEIRADTGLLGGNAHNQGTANHSQANEIIFNPLDEIEPSIQTDSDEDKLVSLRA